jgi:Protein kinase domain/ECF sigma factor
MRIFGGLSVEETAGVLQISSDTVTRDMQMATVWLRRELSRGGAMEPERWSEIERVYHLAREQSAERRNAYLQQACAGDENLRREVESLLRHEDGAEQYLQAAAREVAAQAQDLPRLPAGLLDETEGSLIDRLYHAAPDLEPDERAELIAEVCGRDAELRRDLESLLAQDRSPLALDLYARVCYRVFIQKNGQMASRRLAAAAQHGPYQILGGLRTSGEVDDGWFVPGTLVAQRYRIVSLLGRGGMGKVYRADDLLLGHSVALKFLPAAASETALSRFRNEVRTARQVSHPNVCRVYDIGEADGLIYLTMEYVDGEDLASLLRRIGKLPYDKALDIARGLCAGLAAARDKGMVHRDLKPANVMLDGKGHVRITDFGLAGVAEDVRDPGSGTPAYMAPEQRRGKEVTRLSDIYALGIILHELFTGRRPSEESQNTDLSPIVERVIRRCLEEDPRMRPATALAAAAALPGGDPLAAALAAGEMPSPSRMHLLVRLMGALTGHLPSISGIARVNSTW